MLPPEARTKLVSASSSLSEIKLNGDCLSSDRLVAIVSPSEEKAHLQVKLNRLSLLHFPPPRYIDRRYVSGYKSGCGS